MTIRILADDLTGALDAAAPFATPDAPVRLLLRGDTPTAGGAGLSISSESRDLPGDTACTAVARAHAALVAAGGGGPVWFKKVDSVLRGNSILETLEMMRLGDFATCLFAPAFPGMGRRTQGAMHEVADGDRWLPAPVHDLIAAFAALGVQARPLDPKRPGTGVLIADVLEQADLDRAVAALRDGGNVLWTGSRGLAEALSGGAPRLPLPRIATVVIGTTHPASRAQIAAAAPLFGDDRRLIDPVPEAADARATVRAVAAAVPGIEAGPGRALMVIGGDTLTAVLETAGVEALDCVGEVGPGLPLSIIRGGRLDGVEMVTKSGGFGAPDLLVRMLKGDWPA